MELTDVSELQHTYTRDEYERQVYSRINSCGCLLEKAPGYVVQVEEYEELRRQLRILEGRFPHILNLVKFHPFEKSAKRRERRELSARPENDEPASSASDVSGASGTMRTHPSPSATVQKVRERRPLLQI